MSDLETDDLVAIARGLPTSWYVHVEYESGQMRLLPLAGRALTPLGVGASVAAGRVMHNLGSRVGRH